VHIPVESAQGHIAGFIEDAVLTAHIDTGYQVHQFVNRDIGHALNVFLCNDLGLCRHRAPVGFGSRGGDDHFRNGNLGRKQGLVHPLTRITGFEPDGG
jgi:hypothetical protein